MIGEWTTREKRMAALCWMPLGICSAELLLTADAGYGVFLFSCALIALWSIPFGRKSLGMPLSVRRENALYFLRILLLFYMLSILGMLLIGREPSAAFAERKMRYVRNRSLYLNLKPFRTVRRYTDTLSRDVIPEISIKNLLGNSLLAAPLAVLLPGVFPVLKQPARFIGALLLLFSAVEAEQYLLCIGICDVDDMLLNMFGALLVYGVCRIGKIEELLMTYGLWSEAEMKGRGREAK